MSIIQLNAFTRYLNGDSSSSSSSSSEFYSEKLDKCNKTIIICVVSISILFIILCVLSYFLLKKRRNITKKYSYRDNFNKNKPDEHYILANNGKSYIY